MLTVSLFRQAADKSARNLHNAGPVSHFAAKGPLMTTSERPFRTIESAHQFLSLLNEQIDDVMNEVRGEIAANSTHNRERQVEAWQVVLYTLTKLSSHTASSRRLVNDLRTLRNLLQRTGDREFEQIHDASGTDVQTVPQAETGLATYVQPLPGSDPGGLLPPQR